MWFLEIVKDLIKAHESIKKEVYLDIENSSFVPKEVVNTMVPYFIEKAYGNPTIPNKPGWMAYETIMQASDKIAKFVKLNY